MIVAAIMRVVVMMMVVMVAGAVIMAATTAVFLVYVAVMTMPAQKPGEATAGAVRHGCRTHQAVFDKFKITAHAVLPLLNK